MSRIGNLQESCRLVDAFSGRLLFRMSRFEADSMVRAGTARRSGAYRYLHIRPVPPSDSDQSSPMLTAGDTRIVAGLSKPTLDQAERLQGWGFRVAPPRQDANGIHSSARE